MLDSHAYGADIVRFDAPESESEKKAKANPYNMDAYVERLEKKAREQRQIEDQREEELQYRMAYEQENGDEYFAEIE